MNYRSQSRHLKRRIRKPFCGVDGEGGQIGARHEYLLLRAGEYAIETGEPLTHRETFPFLADLPRDRIYVGYYFDYDVTKILERLPSERIARLLDRDSRTFGYIRSGPLAVDFGPYQFDYLPGKEFKVRRTIIEGKKYTPWTVINDVGSFFQCSFVEALRSWFPEPEFQPVIERIAIGKEQRNSFGQVTEHEREYNKLEIKMLELLMERFREVCDAVDLKPALWQGPGNLVAAQFRKAGLLRNKDIPLLHENTELVQMANDAFYGGRFCARTFGLIVDYLPVRHKLSVRRSL